MEKEFKVEMEIYCFLTFMKIKENFKKIVLQTKNFTRNTNFVSKAELNFLW